MELAALPRRDTDALAHLDRLGNRARPLVLAHDRGIELTGGLGALVPGATLARGSVVRIAGADGAGAGATTLAFELVAAVTGVGEWAGAVDLDGTLGALAAEEAGVALERFAVVRRVPPARWATVVAALLDGVSLVLTDVPRGVAFGDARRLTARARERECRPRGARARGEVAGAGRPHPVRHQQRVGGSRLGGLPHRARAAGAGRGQGRGARPVSGELATAV